MKANELTAAADDVERAAEDCARWNQVATARGLRRLAAQMRRAAERARR